jgi:hypothetical protein
MWRNIKLKLINRFIKRQGHIIEFDTVIYGDGLISLLVGLMLQKQGIHCGLILNETKKDMLLKYSLAISNEIDLDLAYLSQKLDEKQAMDTFKIIMDIFYDLDAMIDHLNVSCDYVRKPLLMYQSTSGNQYDFNNISSIKQEENKWGYSLKNGLYYKSGLKINIHQFIEAILQMGEQDDLKVWTKGQVKTIVNKYNYYEILTTKTKIKCGQFIALNDDLPVKNLEHQQRYYNIGSRHSFLSSLLEAKWLANKVLLDR